MKRRGVVVLWSILAALYLGFRVWYDGGGGPLTAEEVARYLARFQERGVKPERLDTLRAFLAGDTGAEFVMANFIHFHERPGAQEELDRYMAHMYPELLKRACHPVLAGPVVARALDYWGVEGGERWSLVGLVRYRSRRDMLEIATHPAFADAHAFKTAAMQQTIAIPLEPFVNLASPRWIALLALIAGGALLQLLLRARAA